MKILITGGAGFIGSSLVKLALKHGHEVLNVDLLTYAANLRSLDSISENSRYRFLKADICDEAAMAGAVSEFQPEAIMNLAAESHVDRSIDGPNPFIQTNVFGLLRCYKSPVPIGTAFPAIKKQGFDSIIFRPMKYMVI